MTGDGLGEIARQRPYRSGGGFGGDMDVLALSDEHLCEVVHDSGFPGTAWPVHGYE